MVVNNSNNNESSLEERIKEFRNEYNSLRNEHYNLKYDYIYNENLDKSEKNNLKRKIELEEFKMTKLLSKYNDSINIIPSSQNYNKIGTLHKGDPGLIFCPNSDYSRLLEVMLSIGITHVEGKKIHKVIPGLETYEFDVSILD